MKTYEDLMTVYDSIWPFVSFCDQWDHMRSRHYPHIPTCSLSLSYPFRSLMLRAVVCVCKYLQNLAFELGAYWTLLNYIAAGSAWRRRKVYLQTWKCTIFNVYLIQRISKAPYVFSAFSMLLSLSLSISILLSVCMCLSRNISKYRMNS